MQRFRVQCVDRQTGQEHAVLVDALDAESAKAWAIDEGWLVGRVETEAGQARTVSPQLQPASALTAPPTPPAAPAQSSTLPANADTSEALRAIANSLQVIASSSIVAKPRRTLVYCVLLGAGLGGLMTVMLQLAVGLAFPSSSASSNLLGGGSGVSQSQIEGATQSIKDYGELLKKTAENPLGN
ncbi:MAG: hypothetical protein IBJ18_09650 [Phycisphaerales bacterium]|nr:hypothetical protein [Phycisphaerales bacterium]